MNADWTPERRAYVRELAEEAGVPVDTAFAIADMLGPSEDRDGLVSTLEDYGLFAAFASIDD